MTATSQLELRLHLLLLEEILDGRHAAATAVLDACALSFSLSWRLLLVLEVHL